MPFVSLRESGLTPLWTDGPDVARELRSRLAGGQCSSDDLNDLLHFAEHGWVVFPQAIEADLIDAFVADIQGHHRYPGRFLTTDHRRGNLSLRLSGSEPDRYESLFDLYVNFASARRVCMHPRIARFLHLVFDAPPLAFQQLLFQRSNGHRIHQDPSVVCVEQPLWLAASWVALQDVIEGSGELAYYDQSHRLPQYLFRDGSKRFDPKGDSRAAYEAALQDACSGLPYQRFIPRKGDVLLWTADLVHMSHPRRLPEDTPRLSCVTHYCPITTTPFWYRFHPDNRGQQRAGASASEGAFTSGHYRLPTRGRMLTPNYIG